MATKQRFFIELAYDGTPYHGWQLQPNAITVQEVLNKALSMVLRRSVETLGCGRTDTGVHARKFFAHFDSVPIPALQTEVNGNSTVIHKNELIRSINALTPASIAVKRIFPVAAGAHARFDALSRSYQYHIHFNKDPFKNGYSWLLRDEPDSQLMNRAAEILMEYTDFSCFSKSNTQVKTNRCTITRADWVRIDGGMVFHITADRFLRNMVRAIVGTLLQVGRKEIEPYEIRGIIQSKNRGKAGSSVPACGLYLTNVIYPYT